MRAPSDGPVTAGDLLTLEELGHFRRTSTLRGVCLVLHAWGVIAGAIGLYLVWPSGLTLGVAVLVIGTRQLGLMVLMHETAHWLLFRQGRLNTWLCAAPLGADLKAYRRRHHLHHRHTQTSEDPDLALSVPLPVTRARLAVALLSDLGGRTALTRILRWRPWQDGLAQAWRRIRAPLAANAALCAVLTAIGGWPLYLLTWVLPWAAWFHLVTRIRDIAEHGLVGAADDPLRNTRTIGAGLLARALVAPYGGAKDLGGRMERAASYAEVLSRSAAAKGWVP